MIRETLKAEVTGKRLREGILIPLLIVLYAYLLRRYFFSGFILGDDAQELSLARTVLANGPEWVDQLHLRFGVWIFNVIAFRILGVSEFSFFLPTMLLSSTLSGIAYAILRIRNYSVLGSTLGALLVASAPFEVLIGTVRANDLILEWCLALGLLCFVVFDKSPVLRGICCALLMWFGFYVKLWAVYFLPALVIYYLIKVVRGKSWGGAAGFAITSLILHGATCMLWKIKTGYFFPFVHVHAATYPIDPQRIPDLLMQYPRMLLRGSEFGTTLFGAVPYLLGAGLLLKGAVWFSRGTAQAIRFDRLDALLMSSYVSFGLLLNFFPNAFVFDHYYSAPRIFRYLAPLSFPMTLHVTKLLLDGFAGQRFRRSRAAMLWMPAMVLLLLLSVVQAGEATAPGQSYYHVLKATLRDIRPASPPYLLSETWLSYFLRDIYLKDMEGRVHVPPIRNIYHARTYEAWLRRMQPHLPKGTLLLTGLSSYVHYGAHQDGFRLQYFEKKLDSGWRLYGEYGEWNTLYDGEKVRLWRWTKEPINSGSGDRLLSSLIEAPRGKEPVILFRRGMDFFESGDSLHARQFFAEIVNHFPDSDQVENARYFLAMAAFRMQQWKTVVRELHTLLAVMPRSRWVAGAHYHIGVALAEMGDLESAKKEFRRVIDFFPYDDTLVALAKKQLHERFSRQAKDPQ